jgi:hypothetical protein
MPKIAYRSSRISYKVQGMIQNANAIIEEYDKQGLVLSLRQVYYQFVARDLLANTNRNYKVLGNAIDVGRMNGLIDWQAIEDRGRFLRANSHWELPQEILRSAAASYKIDLWSDQSTRVEVWIEKDSLVGIIEDLCRRLDVPCFSCRGYCSQTAMWGAAMRVVHNRKLPNRQDTVFLHFGDHDPSGIDMSRDITDRISLLAGSNNAEHFRLERLALNMDQVRQYRPPPNPAKLTDSRVGGYTQKYGRSSWELDALDPNVLIRLVTDNVVKWRDERRYKRRLALQEADRKRLEYVAENRDLLKPKGGKR